MRKLSLVPILVVLTLLASPVPAQEPPPPRVTLKAENELASTVLANMLSQAKVRFRIETVTKAGLDEVRMTINMTDVPLRTALASILRTAGPLNRYSFKVVNDVYIIFGEPLIPDIPAAQLPLSPPPDDGGLSKRTVTISAVARPMKEVLDLLFRSVGAVYLVSPTLRAAELDRKIEKYEAKDKPFLVALSEVLKAAGDAPITCGVLHGKYILMPRPPALPPMGDVADLRNRKIGKIEVVKSPFPDVISLLMRQMDSDYMIALGPGDPRVSLKAEGIPIGTAVTKLRESNPALSYVHLDVSGGVYVISPHWLIGTVEKEERRFWADFSEVDLRYALKALFTAVGRNYVLDQSVMGVVSVALKEVTFGEALAAILKAAKTTAPIRYRVEDRMYIFETGPAVPRK